MGRPSLPGPRAEVPSARWCRPRIAEALKGPTRRYAHVIGSVMAALWLSSAVAQAQGELPPPPPPSKRPAAAKPAAQPAQPAPTPPAQPAPAPQPAQPAPQPETPVRPAPVEPQAAPAPQDGGSCVPACRSGFVCVEGQCVSACNPPCAEGEQCIEGGQCVSTMPPPPTYQDEYQPSAGQYPDDAALAPADAGIETHDGFMLRLALGFGGGGANWEVGDSDVSVSGFGGGFSLDIGGAPTENLIIHGRLADFVISEPTLTINGDEIGTIDNESLAFFLIGPAVTYYFMPINIYATIAVGLVGGTGDDGERNDDRTDSGWGLNLDVGKEWWAGEQWGLGVAARFWYSRTPDRSNSGDELTVNASSFVLLFSATYQ